MLPDRYTLSLWMLRIAASDENYSRAIWALADAIRATEAAVANAPTKPDAPWIDDFLEESLFVEEGELIENLLGAAFVVCQAHLVSVASRAVRARARWY
ncbi:MAG: hypothetical protein IPN77_33690 [Sandaracinaceae bacterium]|nr:hypothetical protein [Sandaracinaceae bacterium]